MSHQQGPQRHYDKKCFASVVANCADVSSHPAQRGARKELFFSDKNNAVTDMNKTEGAVCSKKRGGEIKVQVSLSPSEGGAVAALDSIPRVPRLPGRGSSSVTHPLSILKLFYPNIHIHILFWTYWGQLRVRHLAQRYFDTGQEMQRDSSTNLPTRFTI